MLVRKAILRYRTERLLKERRAKFGEYHPATFAAYGRAFVAWDGFVKPAHDWNTSELRDDLVRAYTTAQLRALNADGYDNRRQRRAGRKVTTYVPD